MPEPTIVLYVCRHGTTTLNSAGRFRGNSNPPLDDEGLRDANRLAAYFADQPFSYMVTSDRTRAVQTADTIACGRNMEVHKTPTLRAFNVGIFSGQPRSPENVAALQEYIDNPDERIPGGESLSEFRSRIRPAIWEAIEISDDAGLPGLLTAHSSIIHEISFMIKGNHMACLVKPGGAVAIYFSKGKLGVDAILRPVDVTPTEQKADTIS